MKTVKILFTLVGILLLTGAFFSFNSTRSFLSEATLTQGSITELRAKKSRDSDDGSTSITYTPVVKFTTADGEKIMYVSSTSSNPPSYYPGDAVDIYYLPSQPQKAKIDGFMGLWFGTTLLTGLGVVFFFVGFLSVLFTKMKERKEVSLMKSGTPLETTYQGVEHNTGLKINGRSPYRIITHWLNPETSELHIFKSKNIWFDPSRYINNETITVFLEDENLKKYHVDVSFLPEIAK